MTAKKPDASWLIDHPFEDIDGLAQANRQTPAPRTHGIHLDLFFPESIADLRALVNIDDPAEILSTREGTQVLRQTAPDA